MTAIMTLNQFPELLNLHFRELCKYAQQHKRAYTNERIYCINSIGNLEVTLERKSDVRRTGVYWHNIKVKSSETFDEKILKIVIEHLKEKTLPTDGSCWMPVPMFKVIEINGSIIEK
jgi:hypothetical protein